MNINTRVALRQQPGMIGSIKSLAGRVAHIEFDGGGHGRFNIDDLVEITDATPPADKSWPPDLETKAAVT